MSRAAVDAAPIWRLDRAPYLTIGLDEGPEEYLFGVIIDAAFLPDGRIAIADEQTLDVRIYSAEGVHLQTIGRAGEGPGEFRRLYRLGVLKDGALVTWDPGRMVVSSFGATGEFERDWRADACIGGSFAGTGAPGSIASQMGSFTRAPLCRRPLGFLLQDMLLFADGGYPSRREEPEVGEARTYDTVTVSLAAVTPDSVIRIASLPAADYILLGVPPEDYGRLQATKIFGGAAFHAVSAPWLVYGNSSEAAITAYRSDTGERRRLVLDRAPAPVDAAALDSARELHRLRTRIFARDRWNKYFDEFLRASGDLPDHQPFYEDLMLDVDHRVWVGDFLGPWASDAVVRSVGRWWTVLALDGQVVARAFFPPEAYVRSRSPVLAIQGDRVLIRLVDPETDVQRLGVFRLRQQ